MEEKDLSQDTSNVQLEGESQQMDSPKNVTPEDDSLQNEQQTEYYFNKKSRTSNSIKNASFGVGRQVISLILSFVYRTIFLLVLNEAYLGLNGLFTNVLSFLSLAELGIGFSIVYRMYEPIAKNDIQLVASYMRLYRKLYAIIGLFVFIVGLAIMPTIKFMIKDLSEIPSDVNIYVIYFLFLLKTSTSYLFVFRTSILSADQKNYYIDFCGSIGSILDTSIKIALLYLTKNFTFILVADILMALLQNIVMSVIAKKQYPLVFKNGKKLSAEQKKELKTDVFGMMCHKVGGIIVNSTDNILLSMFIGISVVGIYSNYSMLISTLILLMGKVIGTQTAGIGISRLIKTKEEYFELYKKLTFLNCMLTACTSIALFSLISPFIEVWLGSEMLMDMDVVIVLAVCYFFRQLRHVNITFINATGLFKVDKWRPIVAAVVNLVISIVFVKFIGISGIFVGTLASNVCVVSWREAYLLHKREFKTKQTYFYTTSIAFFAASVVISAGLYYLFKLLPTNIGYLILRFAIAGIVPISLLLLLTCWMPECKFFMHKVKILAKKFLKIK